MSSYSLSLDEWIGSSTGIGGRDVVELSGAWPRLQVSTITVEIVYFNSEEARQHQDTIRVSGDHVQHWHIGVPDFY